MNSEEKRQLLRRVRGLVLDMDGTIYLGNELFPFTKAFLEAAGRTGRETFFFTNNSSKNAACYIEKLRGMGIETDAGRMFTSNQVAVRHLAARFPGGRAFILGTPYLQEDFRAAGFTVESDAPDVVVLGFDTTLQYDRLRRACDFIRAGVPYVGVNPDLNCPVEGGGFMPDCGSIARLIEASTGVFPEFYGKPSRHTLDFLTEKTGFAPAELAVVGDRLYTDIALAQGTEATSILVLTGEATREEAERGPVTPTLIVRSLEEITELLLSE